MYTYCFCLSLRKTIVSLRFIIQCYITTLTQFQVSILCTNSNFQMLLKFPWKFPKVKFQPSTLRFDLLSKRNSKLYTNLILLISLFWNFIYNNLAKKNYQNLENKKILTYTNFYSTITFYLFSALKRFFNWWAFSLREKSTKQQNYN